jgi:hypothetical protein
MTKEDEIYFDNYFGLFRNKGWQQLVEEYKSQGQIINIVELTKDGDDLNFRKGQLNIISAIVNLEKYITDTHQAALDADKDVEEDNEDS